MPYQKTVTAIIKLEGIFTKEITDLKIDFDITKFRMKDKTTANSCIIRIYNLNDESFNRIQKLGKSVILKAGYKKDLNINGIGEQVLFIGDIIKVYPEDTNIDKVTVIDVKDGSKALKETKFNKSYKQNTPSKKILTDAINNFNKSFGIKLKKDIRTIIFKNNPNYENGFSFAGKAKDIIDNLSKNMGFIWGIQNNELKIIPADNKFNDGGLTTFISSEFGLIGRPRRYFYKDNNNNELDGWEITTTLQPSLEPGSTITLNSNDVSGKFRVEKIQHKGTNIGDGFESLIELVETK